MSHAPVLYQEARLAISAASPSHILHINTSGLKQSNIFGGRKRTFDEFSGLDEEEYTRKYIATEGSVFFRRHDRAPRSFLWRVVEDSKVLEIQSVDLVHDSKGLEKSDSKLTFRISFNDAIIKGGVAFADPEETDALECYVLTAGRELCTITLKRDLLTRDTVPRDFDPSTCFRKYAPSAFNHRHPYRFAAVSSKELLVSLHDGGFMRLERKAKEPGTQWRESIFSEHTWGNTLRGMMSLKRQQTVRYGDLDLWPSAIAAMVKSPDGKYFWTVNLEHELRIWDAQTGRPIAVMDLLNEKIDEETRKQQRYLMAAEQGTLLRIVSVPSPAKGGKSVAKMDVDDEYAYYVVAHSPKQHEFKFYGVSLYSTPEGEMPHIDDLQAGLKLIPPINELLHSNVWHLEEFFIKPGPQWSNTQVWIRARSGTLCRNFTLTFDLLNTKAKDADVETKWPNAWTVVDQGLGVVEKLTQSVDFPGHLEKETDSAPSTSEKWLDFLFHPGRFSFACLESAVHIYSKARGVSASSGKGLTGLRATLQQRLMQAIGSKIFLKRQSGDHPDYAKYAADIQAQWKVFFSLLSHLHNKRNLSVALAFDEDTELAWSICADFIAPIRAASSYDLLSFNEHLVLADKLSKVDEAVSDQIFRDDEEILIASIMSAAKEFRASLSPEFRDKFARATAADALTFELSDKEASAQHVHEMYEEHNFSAEVMDDDFQALSDNAEVFGGLGSLDTSSLLAILEKMDEEEEGSRGKDANKALCLYGDRLVVETVLDMAQRHHGILLDVLNLVTFMIGDLDEADLHADFVSGTGEIFEAAIVRLKHIELVLWLAGKVVPESQRAGTEKNQQDGSEVAKNVIEIPLLLRLFIGGWKATAASGQALPFLLTRWTKVWVQELHFFQQWDDLTAYVFSFLLRHEFYSLATEFTKFLTHGEDSTSWLSYLEARHALATGDLVSSSLQFRAAAPGMSTVRGIAGLDRAHLLSPEQQTYIGAGASRYFQHVAALYESQRFYSYVADFAALALERSDEDLDLRSSLANIDKRKANKDSPVANKIDDTMQEIQILKARERTEEIRNRLFNALIQTGRFKDAWQCLMHLGETRKANLGTWIKKVVESNAAHVLMEVSTEDIGDVLSQEVDAVLLALAKRSIASRSGTPYHQILYAFRTQRSDFRGAAEILYEYLERIREPPAHLQDPEDDDIVRAYVLLINTLACCGESDAWLLAEPADAKIGKRKLVTLADVRQEYTSELDRRSDVLMGRFPLVAGGDEMDVL